MPGILQYEIDADTVRFILRVGEEPVQPGDWAKQDCVLPDTGTTAGIAPLLSLWEEEAGHEAGAVLEFPTRMIAILSSGELSGLGLPPACPFILQVRPNGILADPSFRLETRWLHPDQRPVQGVHDEGLFLRTGSRRYTIRQPVFDWLNAIAKFNEGAGTDPRLRLPALADVMGEIAESVVLEGQLRDVRIATANGFSLRPLVVAGGELDFEVSASAVSRSEAGTVAGGDEGPVFRSPIPEAKQQRFAAQFRNGLDARASYALGDNWYLAVPPDTLRVLKVVKRFQRESAETRKAFVRSPRTFLKEALAAEDADRVVEATFDESVEYSERVKEIGLWVPKVFPFLRPASQPWLPPEEGGLMVGDNPLPIRPAEIAKLVELVEQAIARDEPFVEAEAGRVPATPESLQALRRLQSEFVPPADTPPKSSDTTEKVPKSRMALLASDNVEVLTYQPEPRPLRSGQPDLPSRLRTNLLQHQVAGLEWLRQCWASGRRGAVLADDMGLGKTLQALTFLSWTREQSDQPRPALIVAPTGLLKNWQKEIQTHLEEPRLGALLEAHGSTVARLRLAGSSTGTEQRHGIPALDDYELRNSDVVLTTYETLRDYQFSFGRIAWGVLVFDEAQKIKNPAALLTGAAQAMNAEFTLAMTGTPVENSLQDLWSIMDTVEPGTLGTLKSFLGRYESSDAARDGALAELKRRLLDDAPPQLMLRRMKADHLRGLPEISHHVIRVVMPPTQAEAYSRIVRSARAEESSSAGMLKVLQSLRMVSLHPDPEAATTGDAFFAGSARLQHLVKILDQVSAAGERALVFVESKQIQGLLVQHLQRRYGLATPPMIINGDVSGAARQVRVEQFQSRKGFDVMLLSPRAGGVGITLTAANHVVHLARWWNPAVEDQCTDRVYRIGQHRPVSVHLPIALHPTYGEASFDHRLHELLERKRNLSRSLLAPVADSPSDVAELFKVTTHVE